MAFRPPKHNADTDPVPPAAAAALFLAINSATLSTGVASSSVFGGWPGQNWHALGEGSGQCASTGWNRRFRLITSRLLANAPESAFSSGPLRPRCCGLALSRGRDADERWWIRKWLLARTSSPPHGTPQHTPRHPWGSSHSNLAPLFEIDQPELASWLRCWRVGGCTGRTVDPYSAAYRAAGVTRSRKPNGAPFSPILLRWRSTKRIQL